MVRTIKTHQELIRLLTFEDRFHYLKLGGVVGNATFGFERYLNQTLYRSKEWKAFRRNMIIRDNGCDLAIEDRIILEGLTLHHINPITIKDIEQRAFCVFDPNNVICCATDTHRAIHFGNIDLLPKSPTERKKGDTCPWIKNNT